MAKNWARRKEKALGGLRRLEERMQRAVVASEREFQEEDYTATGTHITAAIQILEDVSNYYEQKRADLIKLTYRESAPQDVNYDDLDVALARVATIAANILVQKEQYLGVAGEKKIEIFLTPYNPTVAGPADAAAPIDSIHHVNVPVNPLVVEDSPHDINTEFTTILGRLELFEFRAGTQVAADFGQLLTDLRGLPEQNRNAAIRAMRNLCEYFGMLSQPLVGTGDQQISELANRHTQAAPELNHAIESLLGYPNTLLQNIGIIFMAISAALLLAVTASALLALLPAAAVAMPAATVVISAGSAGVAVGGLGIAGFFGGRSAAPYSTAAKLAAGIIADENLGTLVTVRGA